MYVRRPVVVVDDDGLLCYGMMADYIHGTGGSTEIGWDCGDDSTTPVLLDMSESYSATDKPHTPPWKVKQRTTAGVCTQGTNCC